MTEYIIKVDEDTEQWRYVQQQCTHFLGCPLVDEIVRCKDCKNYRASDASCHEYRWSNWDEPVEVEPDGFCAWGERKDA